MSHTSALYFLCCVVISAVCGIDEPPAPVKVTSRVTWDVSVGEESLGQIVIGVFGDVVPITAQNFVELSSGVNGYGYEGSTFHRVIGDFMIQGGDYSNRDGTGIKSIYGGYFDDENFELQHVSSGWISMANAGKDTNGCQFFITLRPAHWLDGKHTVFGKVLEGMDVVEKISKVETDDKDKPVEDVVISKSTAETATDDFMVEIPVMAVKPHVRGVKFEVIKEGDGKTYPRKGDSVEYHYIGTFTDGKKFDSSYDRGQMYKCKVGLGHVIRGMDDALQHMSLGERSKLTLASEVAYGTRGSGNTIPPNSDLVFDVELLAITPAS